jgi:hypothetical protein
MRVVMIRHSPKKNIEVASSLLATVFEARLVCWLERNLMRLD